MNDGVADVGLSSASPSSSGAGVVECNLADEAYHMTVDSGLREELAAEWTGRRREQSALCSRAVPLSQRRPDAIRLAGR